MQIARLNRSQVMNMVILLLSCLAIIGVQLYLNSKAPTYSALSWLLLPLVFIAAKEGFLRANRITVVTSCVFSFLLSSALLIGSQLDATGTMDWSFNSFVLIVPLFLFVLIVSIWVMVKLPSLSLSASEQFVINRPLLFILLFLPHLVMFLILFPGVYGYDAGISILQVTDPSIPFQAQWSILYTLFVGGLVGFSLNTFGNAVVGFAIAMFVQMLFVCAISYRAIIFVYDYSRSTILFALSALFFSLNPLFLVLSVSSTQDVFFGGCFLLLFIELISLTSRRNLTKSSNRNWIIRVTLIAILMSLLRNNGIYILLITLIVVFFVTRGHERKLISLTLAIAIVVSFVILGPAYSLTGVTKGKTIQELSNLSSQQIARVYNAAKTELTPDELDLITRYYEEEPLSLYPLYPSISDTSKSALFIDEVKRDPLGYLRMYLHFGIQYPCVYAEAFLMNTLGFWYPDKVYQDSRMYHPFIEINMLKVEDYTKFDYLSIQRHSVFPSLETVVVDSFTEAAWQRFPFLSSLSTNGLYFFLFLFACAYALTRKAKTFIVPYAMIGALLLSFMLSPLCLFRYCYAFIMCIPIVITLTLCIPATQKIEPNL